MAKITNYIYPHVAVSKYAVEKKVTNTENSTATVLFMPFKSNKGPNNVFKRIYDLNAFYDLYGSSIFEDYAAEQHELLIISNWLSNGGALLALRMTDSGDTAAKYTKDELTDESFKIGEEKVDLGLNSTLASITLNSKYPGTFYNSNSVLVSKKSDTTLSFTIYNANGTELESFTVTQDNITTMFNNSSFLAPISDNGTDKTLTFFKKLTGIPKSDFEKLINGELSKRGELDVANGSFKFTLNGGTNNTKSSDEIFEAILTSSETGEETEETGEETENLFKIKKQLLNKQETPFDVFLDPDYPSSTKKAILQKLAASNSTDENSCRDDAHFYINLFDPEDLDSDLTDSSSIDTLLTGSEKGEGGLDTSSLNNNSGASNVSFYAQSIVVSNPFDDSVEIKVGPTYALSILIPTNDTLYGIQYPTAGLTRGVITDIKSLSENPSPSDKNNLYESKVNYIEKDYRNARFMCQLTRSEKLTALSYVNNSRTTEKIAKDIEDIGREYLFEFNDTTTLTSLKNEVNNYLNQWVQKRVLSSASAEIEKISDTSVAINIYIKFTGTIEIIAVSITIE